MSFDISMGFNCLLYIFHFKMHPYYHDSFPRLRGGHVRLRYGSRLWWRCLAAPRRCGPSGLALWSYGVGSPLSLQTFSCEVWWHLGTGICRVVLCFFISRRWDVKITGPGSIRVHPMWMFLLSCLLSLGSNGFLITRKAHLCHGSRLSLCIWWDCNWICSHRICWNSMETVLQILLLHHFLYINVFRNLLQICTSFYHQPKAQGPLKNPLATTVPQHGEGRMVLLSLRFLAQQAALLYLRLGQDLDSPVHGEGGAVEAVAIIKMVLGR